MTNKENKYALTVTNLTTYYTTENKIFNSVNCTIPTGVRCAIVGLNGAGKTTFLKSILGLEKPQSGIINFWGSSFNKVNNQIAYVPQIKTIDWTFPITVEKVVKMGCYQIKSFFNCSLDINANEKVTQALIKMNLFDKKNEQINTLSGGQKQRVFLARALAQNPNLYILDEPLAGVDIISEKIISTLFKEITDEKKTVIAVHHDLYTLYDYFDWIIIINKGILYQGELNKNIVEPFIQKAFSN